VLCLLLADRGKQIMADAGSLGGVVGQEELQDEFQWWSYAYWELGIDVAIVALIGLAVGWH
jgi:hypothetical protein